MLFIYANYFIRNKKKNVAMTMVFYRFMERHVRGLLPLLRFRGPDFSLGL